MQGDGGFESKDGIPIIGVVAAEAVIKSETKN